MHSSKKGNQWYFGTKAHIGVDADFGLMHTVRGTAGHVADVTEGNAQWQMAMLAGKRKKLDKANSPINAFMDKIEKCKASIRAKAEQPFRLNQAPVWLREGALPGTENTHTAAQNPVCAVHACGWHATN